VAKEYEITLIPGDGTGPELVNVVKNVVANIGINIRWDEVDAGEDALAKHGTPLPDFVLESVRKNKVALKGPCFANASSPASTSSQRMLMPMLATTFLTTLTSSGPVPSPGINVISYSFATGVSLQRLVP
jgi:isocitrate/isopropylmalate dehydrogenase